MRVYDPGRKQVIGPSHNTGHFSAVEFTRFKCPVDAESTPSNIPGGEVLNDIAKVSHPELSSSTRINYRVLAVLNIVTRVILIIGVRAGSLFPRTKVFTEKRLCKKQEVGNAIVIDIDFRFNGIWNPIIIRVTGSGKARGRNQ